MKKLITIALVVIGFQWATAQDEAVFTHYHINPILINPAHAGFTELHHIQMNLRNQWAGFPRSSFYLYGQLQRTYRKDTWTWGQYFK